MQHYLVSATKPFEYRTFYIRNHGSEVYEQMTSGEWRSDITWHQKFLSCWYVACSVALRIVPSPRLFAVPLFGLLMVSPWGEEFTVLLQGTQYQYQYCQFPHCLHSAVLSAMRVARSFYSLFLPDIILNM